MSIDKIKINLYITLNMIRAIYIPGISGMLLFIEGVPGIFLEYRSNIVVLLSGLVMVVLGFIPLLLVQPNRCYKKLDAIIVTYRNRNSGFTWGRGNINAAEAKRRICKAILS